MKCCDSGLLRRQKAAQMLYEYLDNNYHEQSNIIVLGDWNDDTKDDPGEHCFEPFFQDDRFYFTTRDIAFDISQASYPKEPYVSFLDHIMVSEDLLPKGSSYDVQTILMGDFNSEPDTPEYTLLAGEPGQRVGQVEYTDRFVDAWRMCHPHEDGFTQSAGADPEANPPRRVDYCFVSQSLKAHVNEAWVDTHADGSDHQPCWFDIDL